MDDHGSFSKAWADTITAMLAMLVCVAALMLPHVAVKVKAAAEATTQPGNVIVEVRWPDDADVDVDTWVLGPNDKPVGYSAKAGNLFNLLRDDLGKRVDDSNLNYEVAYSRGARAGRYTVNIHLYRNLGWPLPLPVTVVASVKTNPDERAVIACEQKVNLDREGQELTVCRFELDAAGRLVPGSVDTVQVPLRNYRA